MNDHALFRPKKSDATFPWYDRKDLPKTTQFGPDQDGFTVFVTAEVSTMLQEETRQKLPQEAFGLLMGRVYEDNLGPFTIVSGVVYAHKLEASSVHVHLTAKEAYDLRCEARRVHPAMDIVGWTHSHPGKYHRYSPDDLREQSKWRENYQVGILTFMTKPGKAPWAIAYRGPTGRRLPLVRTALMGQTGKTPPASKGKQETLVLSSTGKEPSPPGSSERSCYMRLLQSPLVFGLIIIAIALGVVLGNLVSADLHLTSATAPATSLLWDCDQVEGPAPLKITCTGPVSPNITRWHWDFGDGTTMEQNTVSHIYKKPGIYTLRLMVIASSINQYAGSLDIKVVAASATPGSTRSP